MMSIQTNEAIDRIEAGFFYDVTKATVALFYLLQGMEIASHAYESSPCEKCRPQPTVEGPRLTHLKTFPAVTTTGLDMMGPSGEACQLAYKGWVADIYDKWEKSRTKTLRLLGDEGIRPKVDCMGDFRHIRHDLIHSGSATKEHTGKCKVLRWFESGQQMILTTDHVFDFLNQMNLITLPIQFTVPAGQRIVSWMLVSDADKPTSLKGEQIRLVSARMDADADGPGGSRRYMVSCAFSDGVFGQGEVEVPLEPKQFLGGYIDQDGNITFPGGQILSAGELYDACYGYLKDDRKSGPGILGPDTKYMKESDC